MNLKKYLTQFSKEQLIEQILELNKKYKDVKTYYKFSLDPDLNDEKEKVKHAVYECFFPKRGYKLRLGAARKMISDFKKLEPDAESLADVMLYYVETGLGFTNKYGNIDEPFYNSMSGMYDTVSKFIKENDLGDTWITRAKKIMDDSSSTRWDFHYALRNIYNNYYEKSDVKTS